MKIGSHDTDPKKKNVRIYDVLLKLIIMWHHELNRESARGNYGYEFLIKMTFIWEPDEDKRIFQACHLLVENFAWVPSMKMIFWLYSQQMTNAFNEIRLLSV